MTATGHQPAIISGSVLAAARRTAGLTQEDLAEAVGASVDAVKRWENGQRALGRTKAADLIRMRRRLRQLGARASLLSQLPAAIEADEFIAHAITGDCSLLATEVTTRSWSSLLAWAAIGTPPAEARDVARPRPLLPASSRTALFSSLRSAANRPLAGSAHLLRHQAFYLSAWDTSAEGRSWLTDASHAEARRIHLTEKWNPDWPVTRSLAVAAACQGDPEPLRWFIRHQMSDPVCDAANLAYWAYWISSDSEPASGEEFMIRRPLTIQQGTALLQHLSGNLTPDLPYAELSVRSLSSLLRRWPDLLHYDPALAADLASRASFMLDTGEIMPPIRRELSSLFHATTKTAHIRRGSR